ncbi:MAG: hypothetical protein ACPGYV_07835 [Phycisphaeraceae bacterium]
MTTLNTPNPTPDAELAAMQSKLRARLSRLGLRLRAMIAFDALVRGAAVLLALLAVSIVLDFWLELSRPMRVFYWLGTLAAAAHFFYHYGIKPLSNRLGPVQLAEAVDIAKRHQGGQQLAPRVATVLQLPHLSQDAEAFSGLMIRDAVRRSYASLDRTDFGEAISARHGLQCVGILAAALLVSGLTGVGMSAAGENVIGTWAKRWLTLSETPYPRNTSIEIVGLGDDGTLTVPAGENVTLFTRIATKDGRSIEDARIKLDPAGGREWPQGLDQFDPNDFRYELSPITEPAEATISAGDQTLRFAIRPAARPRLTGIKLTHTHPSAPDRPRVIDFDGAEGEVSLLERNEVELLLTANVPLSDLRYADETTSDETTDRPAIQRVNANTYKLEWTHSARQRLRVELVSESAGLVSQPVPIAVGLKTDRKPSVRLRYAGVGQRVTPNALIPLNLEARDDYGLVDATVSPVRIRVGSDDAGTTALDPIVLHDDATASETDVRKKHGLEVDQLGVRPTDVIRLTGLARDDRYAEDPEAGGQVGESSKVDFRVVTHKELFREIIARQQQARGAFRQAIEDSKDVLGKLREAGNNGVAVASQSRRFRAIQRSVWKVSRELERSAEEMRLNRLGGSKEDGNQAYESMKATILEPLAQLHDRTMADQRAALEQAGTADATRLDAIRTDQQGVIDEMTLLLSKMNRWDELLDAINQLSEVIDQQETLKRKVDELIDEQIDDLFDE